MTAEDEKGRILELAEGKVDLEKLTEAVNRNLVLFLGLIFFLRRKGLITDDEIEQLVRIGADSLAAWERLLGSVIPGMGATD